MKTLTIRWQRLVEAGETCPRCGGTGLEVRTAAKSLAQALAPLGIEVVLDEVELGLGEFERQPIESNRILIGGCALEEWLGGEIGQSTCCAVCGSNECRTLMVDGKTHETIPADLIIRAGLLAAAAVAGRGSQQPCCAPVVLGHPHQPKEERTIKIQVLGTACAKCKQLTANVERAVAELGIVATVEKVEDVREIMKFQVMSPPALALDGKVVSTGKVLSPEDVKALVRARA